MNSTKKFADFVRGSLSMTRTLSTIKHGGGTKVGQLNHIAIAVPNLKDAMKRFGEILGVEVSTPQRLPEHGVTVAFVQLANTKLELLEPLGDTSPIANFLVKYPAGGMHHMCLEVNDIHGTVDRLQQDNVRIIDPKPRIGAHGTPVIFLHPKELSGVLTELEEIK